MKINEEVKVIARMTPRSDDYSDKHCRDNHLPGWSENLP